MPQKGVNRKAGQGGRRVASAFAIAVIAALIAAGAALAQEQDTPPPAVAPTATPSPADPALAAQFAGQGKRDDAIGAYHAVIEQGGEAERLAAHFALAQLLLDDGQPGAAEAELDAYLLEAPPGADVRSAQFLLAETLAAQGRWTDALLLYEAYLQAGGGASLYARIGHAEALAQQGLTGEAIAQGEALLREEEIPASIRVGFIFTMAVVLEDARPADALAWYDRLRDASGAPADQALALWRSAQIREDLGDVGAVAGTAPTIVERYPGTSTALEVVENFPETAAGTDGYQTGLVYYLNGRADEAREIFEGVAGQTAGGGNAARASFYLGVLDEQDGDIAAAMRRYGAVVQLDPSIELADDALWWLGRLQETEGRLTEARVTYTQLSTDYGGSDWGAKARFRLALLDYDDGAYEAAAIALERIAADGDGAVRERALLWAGKALAAQGDREGAETVWRGLRAEGQDGYYGLRAGVLLGEESGSSNDADLSEAGPIDWRAIETWLSERADVDAGSALQGIFFNAHWGLGQELLALGMERSAGAEFGVVLEDAGDDPAALYQLARFLHPRGVHDVSSRAATRLLNALPDDLRSEAPADLYRLAYPIIQQDLLDDVLEDGAAGNLVMLALVRQESFFDPLAGSTAGALGLTQVIPPTGTAIAQELGIEDFRIDDLFLPATSLIFADHYLGQQLDLFDGGLYEALAAYNGGPGSALRWSEAAGEDTDRFVEEIEFGQTEAYVKLVSENLARYRQLYLGLDAPALPED